MPAFRTLLKAHGAHVDAFYFCPHDRLECNCRKPLPGMFEQAQLDFPEISATTSAMIGDSLPDIEFGRRLGMRTVFIEGDAERQKPGAAKAASWLMHTLLRWARRWKRSAEELRTGRPQQCLGDLIGDVQQIVAPMNCGWENLSAVVLRPSLC